jgi:hypothetical protein
MRWLLTVALFLSFKAQAYFPINPLVQVRGDLVSAQVYNPYYEPILCEGLAHGLTASGAVFNARIADIIPPGQNRYAFVRTNPFMNPFVNGWAQVMCRFAYRWY